MDSFYFKIYRKGLFSDLGKLLGMQDISVGYSEFDEDFIIKGNDEEKLTRLFSNEKIEDYWNYRNQYIWKLRMMMAFL